MTAEGPGPATVAAEQPSPPYHGRLTPTIDSFARYLVVGGASFVVDVFVLVVMRDIAGAALWIATSTGFGAAFAVNFGLNMAWVFSASGRLAPRLLRYTLLVVLNYLITLAIVLGIASLGVSYLVAKAVAVAVCVGLNFILYRTWVFS